MGWATALSGAASGVSLLNGLGSLGRSSGMSREQRAMLEQSREIAGWLHGIGESQNEMYQEFAPEVYGKLFDEINQGPDYEGATGLAVEDVNQSFDQMDEEQERYQTRYSIDPSSGRAMGLRRTNGLKKALAMAHAKNKARREEDDKNWARLTGGASLAQGFMSNAVNAGNAAAGQLRGTASQYGGMADRYAQDAGDSFYSAARFANGLDLSSLEGSGNSEFDNFDSADFDSISAENY